MRDSFNQAPDSFPNLRAADIARRHRWRALKDVLAHYGIAVGGVGVIVAVLLIFVYLLYIVLPMFSSAKAQVVHSYTMPGSVQGASTLLMDIDEQGEVAGRFLDNGEVVFFKLSDASVVGRHSLGLAPGVHITSVAQGTGASGFAAFGLSDGTALIVKLAFEQSYPNDQRVITPVLKFPVGETPLAVDDSGEALVRIALSNDDTGSTTLLALTDDGRLLISRAEVETTMMGDVEVTASSAELPPIPNGVAFFTLSGDHRWAFAADNSGNLHLIDVSDLESARIVNTAAVIRGDNTVTQMRMLLGGISVLVGTSDGRIEQWFTLRDANNNYSLAKVREFDALKQAIVRIEPEAQRKGFVAIDAGGHLGIFHSTAHRTLLLRDTGSAHIADLALAPRSNKMLIEDALGKAQVWDVHNEHPEISFSALWEAVWYESYPKPDYIWQSSAANQDFEPKFSLTPLAFGTLKAAFYAMLVAMPLAIMGAMFTGYFMTAGMRRVVKPSIEIMEALPTVILGFLAGLWLAPFLETHLPGVFALLICMPLGIVVFGFLWHLLPKGLRARVPDGSQAALLVPVVAFIAWFSFAASGTFEYLFFGGDFKHWLTHDMGIDYDQRNSIVVGFAMGFAVIPTIFSITEDAVFGVPKHLTVGSLALGATPWQTLMRVVLPSASPGIFSGVMIGLGRAVGETMIVLMATGNTPIMDANIFEGMRTLSANIAVEMPESEVGSTHYRVLFLAALVLFLFTFILNTGAEIIRQRLRKKYASL